MNEVAHKTYRLFRIDWMSPRNMDRVRLRVGAVVKEHTIIGYTCRKGWQAGQPYTKQAQHNGRNQTFAIGESND